MNSHLWQPAGKSCTKSQEETISHVSNRAGPTLSRLTQEVLTVVTLHGPLNYNDKHKQPQLILALRYENQGKDKKIFPLWFS